MAGEEAVREADVVANKNSKTQTEKAGAKDEGAIEPGEPMARKGKRQGQGRGDQHHASDGANAENEQVQQRPLGLADGA